ncbi:MAG: hypothetical protein H7039_24315, partial [Bryobacteraceae bacterium]|nr:hypothetical protein [Bryobacteraceae bacterium]
MENRIAILTFPQFYDGARLHVRVLVVPRLSGAWNGNPLDSVIDGFPNAGDTTPAFADADLQLEARIIRGLEKFPSSAPADAVRPLVEASGVRPNARALFEEMTSPAPGRFKVSAGTPDLAEEAATGVFIRKYLPVSYRESFLFTGPRAPGAVTDDSYHCAIKAKKDPNPAFVVTPDEVSWGQVYAYCLRHFRLAEELGLIRSVSFDVDEDLVAEGAFLYVDLQAGSAYAAQTAADFTFLKRYAARIPRLKAGEERSLFGAVLFPVVFDDAAPGLPPSPGNFETALAEAAQWDDGFASIVHAKQPVSQNLLEEKPDGFAPLTDIGIRLGWDDEQILIWQNRQMTIDTTVPKIAGKGQRLDAPSGVFGYRVDARKSGDDWRSLVRVQSKAPLALGDIPLGEGVFEGELGVEVHPMQLDGDQKGQFWLPSYLAQWNGKSLVLPDEDAARVFKTEEALGAAAALGRMYDPVGLDQIPLLYGEEYEFRVRMMDVTGGGPEVQREPKEEISSAITSVRFRRYVVPEPVRIEDLPRMPDAPADALFPLDQLTVRRPLLGYPSVVFTGKYADPVGLLEAASTAAVTGSREAFGIPDPDVTTIQIDVEIKTLQLDNLQSLSGKEPYIALYKTTRAFDAADFDQARVIPLEFVDAHVLRSDDLTFGDLGVTQAELDAGDALILPRARDIRLTIRALAGDDPAYFAKGANVG